MQPLKVKEIVKEKEEKELVKIQEEEKHYRAIVKSYPLKDSNGEEKTYGYNGRITSIKDLIRPESPPKKVKPGSTSFFLASVRDRMNT